MAKKETLDTGLAEQRATAKQRSNMRQMAGDQAKYAGDWDTYKTVTGEEGRLGPGASMYRGRRRGSARAKRR